MREQKFYRLEREKYLQGLTAERKFKTYTAEEYYKAFTNIFPINESREKAYAEIVMRLCCYFSGDKRFENNDFKLNRGLLIFGGVGVGKTTLLQMFRRNQAFSYRLISCRDIENEYGVDGPEAISRYTENYPVATNSNPFGALEIGYCFDDLGTENAVTKHFGNSKNVMADIILNRYDRIKQMTEPGKTPDFRSTHITTNLSADELFNLYGTRVNDRIAEMFNLIKFDKDAKSRR